ncbi:MAG: DUF1566 domain-containing protein [Ferruginibacter sp.]
MPTEQTPLYRYPGTKPFEAGDYALFKGRDDDIIKLFDIVFIENPVVLFSRSGLGKSSLLNAGLYNKIINENKATPLFIRFGACYKDTTVLPLEKLTEVINKLKRKEQNPLFEKLVSQVIDNQYSLWYKFKNIQINDPARNSFVLIFDQFEELFTYPQHAIDQFKKELSELLYIKVPQELRDFMNEKRKTDSNFISKEEANLIFATLDIRILFAIRSDKLSLLNSLTGFFPTVLKNCYELRPLSRDQAKQAIIFPAQLQASNFESNPFVFNEEVLNYILDSLTETNDHDAIGATIEKPQIETFQLQIVCKYAENLVIEKGLKEITKKDLGDIKLIFENQYKNIINKLPEVQQLPARIMMEEKLIVEKTRVSMPEISLLKEVKEKGLTRELIDYLINTHIIRRDQSGTIEISHDTLVEPILKSKKEREDKEELARIEAEKQEELRQQKEKTEKEKLELAKTRKRLRIVNSLLGGVLLALIVAGFLGAIAYKAKNEARNQQGIAEAASREANEQKDKAEKEKQNAKTSAIDAIKQQGIAEAASREAGKQKDIAEKQKQKAETSAKVAIKQQGIAEAASIEANIQKDIAEKERQKAETSAKDAIKQQGIAEAASIEANKQKDTAESSNRKLQEFTNTVIGARYKGGIIAWKDGTGKHFLIAAENDLPGGNIYTRDSAKKACKDYSVKEGDSIYLDWHLPTQDELNKLYVNKDVVGGFAKDNYWSSSESFNFRGLAWFQHFYIGFKGNITKNRRYRVRPVRAF